MSHVSDDLLTLVGGDQGFWTIDQRRAQITGPENLVVDGVPLLQRSVCNLGPSTDSEGMFDSFRCWRKGNILTLQSKGYVRSGQNKINLVHTSRYGGEFTKITTDIMIPKGFTLATNLGVGSLVLPDIWEKYRFICSNNGDLELSPWKRIITSKSGDNVIFSRSQPPLSVIFGYGRIEMEVLTGIDLWRWEKGVCGSENRGKFELIKRNDGLHFQRYVTDMVAPVEPKAGSYRFSWYLSWFRRDNKTRNLNLSTANPFDGDLGELNFSKLSKVIEDLPQKAALEIDLDKIAWHASACRVHKNNAKENTPCLASSNARRALKRLIRQLKAAAGDKSLSVVFRGIKPGLCQKGRHVSRKKNYRHWDLPAMLDLFLWIRKILGDNFELLFEPSGICSPSIENIFTAPYPVIKNGNQV